MKRVEMSAAGLVVLLERAEAFLSLWDIVSYPGQKSTPLHADLAEASREARTRLGLPLREPGEVRQPASMFIHTTFEIDGHSFARALTDHEGC